jgi:hypothetical protein
MSSLPPTLKACLLGCVSLACCALGARETNYDEAKVHPYTLPDPLVCLDGTAVKNAADWTGRRRPEIVRLFEDTVYGKAPGKPAGLRWERSSVDSKALGGLATRKQLNVFLTGDPAGPVLRLLIYQPNQLKTPAPVFLGMNFGGNSSVHKDPGISLNPRWEQPDKKAAPILGTATEASRGSGASQWPVELLLSRGYALATFDYNDVTPDFRGLFTKGIHAAYFRPGQTAPEAGEWGAIAAWAWGLSRAMDCLAADPELDATRVAIVGFSRLGKATLWAGALDPRFALVISNNSGCLGAALNRRWYGEQPGNIIERFPHWTCPAFHRFADREDDMPVDQHELLALIAPRPLYVASATEDRWADPLGEYLSAWQAGPVYSLFGLKGLPSAQQPAPELQVGDSIGYHLRVGKHALTEYDWRHFLNFADRKLGR